MLNSLPRFFHVYRFRGIFCIQHSQLHTPLSESLLRFKKSVCSARGRLQVNAWSVTLEERQRVVRSSGPKTANC
jgi:hypothetical protein